MLRERVDEMRTKHEKYVRVYVWPLRTIVRGMYVRMFMCGIYAYFVHVCVLIGAGWSRRRRIYAMLMPQHSRYDYTSPTPLHFTLAKQRPAHTHTRTRSTTVLHTYPQNAHEHTPTHKHTNTHTHTYSLVMKRIVKLLKSSKMKKREQWKIWRRRRMK